MIQKIDYFEKSKKWTIKELVRNLDISSYKLSEIKYKTNFNGFLSAIQLVYNVDGLESPMIEADNGIDDEEFSSI